MRRIISIVRLCTVGALVLSVVAVASASAEVLVELEKGNFPATFLSHGGKVKLQTLAGGEIKCEEIHDKGTIGSSTEGGGRTAHLGTAEVKFLGCRSASPSDECKSSGANAEEIVIPSAEFHLGLAHVPNGPTNLPAILFLLPGGKFTFKCSLASVELKGDVIGHIEGEVQKFLSEATVSLTQSTPGMQSEVDFLLSLSTEPLMEDQHLTLKTTLFTTEESESGVTASDTLDGFKNSAGEVTKIKLVFEPSAPPEVLFELEKGSFPATFLAHGGEVKLQTLAGSELSCLHMDIKGTIGSSTEGGGRTAHLGTAEVKFLGCRSASPNVECKSSGANAEEIVIPSAGFHLGLVHAPNDLPAILFLLPGGKFTFKCSLASVELKGAVIGRVEGEVEKFLSEATVSLTQSTPGMQSEVDFLLSLSTEPLMEDQHLTLKTTLFTTEESESGVTASDTLEGFKNGAGEATKIKLVLA